MASINTATRLNPPRTYEGGKAHRINPELELRRTVMTCLLWERAFYESGKSIADRIKQLVTQVAAVKVLDLAIEARNEMMLRHVPLLLVREVARLDHVPGSLVRDALAEIIQRADELTEYLAIYFQDGKQPLTRGVKMGLAKAFTKFDAYQLAKYDRDDKVKLRDVLFLCHPKPKDKKETFERLLGEGKLGGLAVLRNLRNMQKAGVDEDMIASRLRIGIKKALPFRFVTAARYAPSLEEDIEIAMLKAVEGLESLPGKTGLLIDVSYSMESAISDRSETSRIDVACGLAILLREKAHRVKVATFSNRLIVLPPRRGFALSDAITQSQIHHGTYQRGAIE